MVKVDRKKILLPITRDYTIHIHKAVHRVTFKRKAPTAIKKIKQFASKVMKTKDVRIDTKLNKFIWSNGIKNLPKRVRVRISRQRNDDEDAKEKMYALVQHIPVESFEGLQTEIVAEE
ncbi:large subunit ribosomal protein L31e [Babesia microti strain RI]|uniref:Large subunit ribosomal protein L31e n=1 Tax=Babesia microti (strain RI) TaxID=1133968 RepID=A0A1R4AB91_BABMR|nr:large subunit ribosomal protein L31e [Babesia microti strain RI]SJK86279.1 large subunit ribosomal protein L31e [Babesia microti strain RI]|eukprot:XP_021338456.1 large subunit ribosomal protein L31e [Babesia microti strain RI]